MAPTTTQPQSSPEDQLEALGGLFGEGVSLDQLLSETTFKAEAPRRKDVSLPGVGRVKLSLSPEALSHLEWEIGNLLDDYDRVMTPRHQTEEEINAAYAQRSDALQRGTQPGDARLVSELTMYVVDQLTARLANNVRSVEPLARCTPIIGDDAELAVETAHAAEHFLQAYGERVIKIPVKLSQAIHRSCRVGTAVIRVSWVSDKRRSGERGRIRWDLVPNRLVKVWPPNIWDWQEDYFFVGHESFMTRSQWRTLARQLGLDRKMTEDVEATAGWERDRGQDKILADQDIERSAMSSRGDELCRTTELYLHTTLPGEAEPDRYHLHFSRPLRKIVWIDHNRNWEQDHPYYPIRYKYVDESAWGNGAGHELLFPQAAGSAMRNIQMDSLMSSCYHFVVCKPDYIHQQQTGRPLMGQKVPSEDPNNDYIPRKLGGPVPELTEAKLDNDQAGMRVSGVPPVLSGMGDPIQKSGTGTGATQALIGEAGKKHGYTDQTLRDDIAPLLLFTLKLTAQAAPDGVWYEYASPDDAERLQLIRYRPPQGELGQIFKISVQAPNAATSREGRQQAWLLLYQFLRDHLTTWGEKAIELLKSENPAAVQRLMHEILAFQGWLAGQLVEDYQLPGARELLPQLPEPVESDQVINELQGQVAQLTQQAQQLAQQLQAVLQPAQPGTGMMGMPGMAPQGAEQEGEPQGPPPGPFAMRPQSSPMPEMQAEPMPEMSSGEGMLQ